MDDQTMTGLAAVYQALHSAGMKPEDCRDWGVVAAPRFLGRSTLAVAFPKFLAEGAWGVSPHTIPYFSLHSVAGATSQALQIRGPNLGVGGGPDGEVEALLAAMAMLSSFSLPGVLVVLTGWEPEFVPDAPESTPPIACRAIALALMPGNQDQSALRLSIVPPTGTQPSVRPTTPASASSRCKALLAFLNDKNFAAVHWPMAGGGVLAWRRGTDEATT
jgi:hypothetical protein